VELAPAAVRDLRKFDPYIRKHVIRDILRLEDNPRPNGAEMLESKEKLYLVYVGPGKDYRAIYQIRDAILVVRLSNYRSDSLKWHSACMP
jgi:mRNA interferase RelE/StbE